MSSGGARGLRLVWWLSLGTGAFGGMLLAGRGLRAEWPWSYPAWSFWSVFWELATMPVAGFGGVGLILALPLLALAIVCLHFSRTWGVILATVTALNIAFVVGYLWMHLGDLVASLGV